MRLLIRPIIFITLLTTATYAAPKTMNDIYSEFQSVRTQLDTKTFTAATFSSQFREIDEHLQNKYMAFRLLEKGKLTSEGNQMVYDLELLKPLRTIAETQLTKDDCQRALHDCDFDFDPEDKKDNKTMKTIIKKICNLN